MAKAAFFKLGSVSGALRWRRHSINVKCRIRVDQDGLVRLTPNSLNLDTSNAWLLKLSSPKARFLTKVTFEGAALTGERIVSNAVFLDVTTNSTPTSAKLRIKGNAYHLRVDYVSYPKISRHCTLVYGTVGMLAYGHPRALTNLGNLTLAGPHKIKQYELLHGTVTVEAPKNQLALTKWIAACDRMTDRILEIISFGEGRLISWSVRSLYKGNNPITHEFFGPQRTTEPHDPVFYFLNLQPVLDLAVTRYTQFIRRNLGFGVALEWFLQRPSYVEVQLLTAMTAIEHLVSVFKQKHGGATNIADNLFKAVIKPARKRLDAIKTSTPETRAAIGVVRSKLMQANDGTLKANLDSMISSYKVPIAGLETRIARAIKARNWIVHRGLYSITARRQIYSHVAVLRELFKRMFLAILRYEGQYRTFLDRSDEANFPPAAT